ncbi:MAG: ABC transporter permease [Bacteroidetes bacterium]|nr:ABC transporter permease [Bacteroidota bacterium]
MLNKNYKKKKLGSYPIISVVISTTSALFVSGLLGILLLHTNKISDIIRDNVKIFIYLNKNISKENIEEINNKLKNQKFILKKRRKPLIKFISKEDAAKSFIKETGENFWEVVETNPLRDMITIGINYDFQTKEVLEAIKRRIEKIEGVYEVNYAKNLTIYINKNLTKARNILWFFGLLLFLTVIILINNTIKLALYSQRFLIRSMQLVGAYPSFIKRPFLIRATITGLCSGMLASILILLILEYTNIKSEALARIQEPKEVFTCLFFVISLGIIIDVLGTYISVNKYLKMSLDELY